MLKQRREREIGHVFIYLSRLQQAVALRYSIAIPSLFHRSDLGLLAKDTSYPEDRHHFISFALTNLIIIISLDER